MLPSVITSYSIHYTKLYDTFVVRIFRDEFGQCRQLRDLIVFGRSDESSYQQLLAGGCSNSVVVRLSDGVEEPRRHLRGIGEHVIAHCEFGICSHSLLKLIVGFNDVQVIEQCQTLFILRESLIRVSYNFV